MKDTTLLRIALITGTVGLLALYFVYSFDLIPETSPLVLIEDDRTIKIEGTISGISSREAVTYVYLERTETVPVVFFDDISYYEGQFISITGDIESYNGKKQIIAR